MGPGTRSSRRGLTQGLDGTGVLIYLNSKHDPTRLLSIREAAKLVGIRTSRLLDWIDEDPSISIHTEGARTRIAYANLLILVMRRGQSVNEQLAVLLPNARETRH